VYRKQTERKAEEEENVLNTHRPELLEVILDVF
jgi:hypothetical protein